MKPGIVFVQQLQLFIVENISGTNCVSDKGPALKELSNTFNFKD